MGQSGPPAVAVVGVVVGEHLVAGVEVGLEVVAGAAGEDLQLGAVGLAAEGAPPPEGDDAAVGPGGRRDPLVPHGDVESAVDAELDARDDVVVEAAVVGRAEVLEQVDAGLGLAVAVGVAEDAEEGHVADEEGAVAPGHPLDGAQALGEDAGDLAVEEGEDAAVVGLGGPDLVHRVLGQEQRAVGGGGELEGVFDLRNRGDQLRLEALGHPGQRGCGGALGGAGGPGRGRHQERGGQGQPATG